MNLHDALWVSALVLIVINAARMVAAYATARLQRFYDGPPPPQHVNCRSVLDSRLFGGDHVSRSLMCDP